MNKKYNQRIVSIYLAFVFLFFIISLKIFYLQILRSNFFQRLAQNQHYWLLRLEGKRGDIFDRRGRNLATNINYHSIFADPLLVSNPQATAEILSLNLGLEKNAILSKLKEKKRFIWIKRKVSLETKEKIKAAKLKGIGFLREEKRFYPQDDLLSSVIGIVDIDNKGLEGVELFYNDYLNGKDGWVRVLKDSASQEIILSSQIITPQKGADLILTIDAQIQYWAQQYLKEAIKDFRAASGSVIAMDASSGEILSLVNYPAFNLNKSDSRSSTVIKNKAISDMFEPGSVFKIVTLLAAINENKFSDEDKIFCENGKFKIPGSILHDHKPYGELSFKEVFSKSSNIGVAKIVQSLGQQVFFDYIKLLQFGRLSGIDLPGEIKGSLKPLSEWSKTSEYIVPIGHEIGVNLLQFVRVFATVVYGGYLVKPHIVGEICSQGFCKNISSEKQRVFSKSVTERAKKILIEVVENGTGQPAGIADRVIGGKTGTAQKYDPKIGRYLSFKYQTTFIGFIADLDPALVIAVSIDEPRKAHFGGVVAAPVFKKIAQQIIEYFTVNNI